MLFLCLPAYSQYENFTSSQAEHKAEKIDIYFNPNSCVIDSMYMNNGESVQALSRSINALLANPKIEIIEVALFGYSSPDGGLTINNALSENRNELIYRYLIDECSVPNSLITIKNCGVAWDLMREYVVESEVEHKIEIADIIDQVPTETWERVTEGDKWLTLVGSRNKCLMDLRQGAPYRQMRKYIFPYLRKSSIEITYAYKKIEPVAKSDSELLFDVEPAVIPEIENGITFTPSNQVVKITRSVKERLPRNPIFAVKTNLAGLGAGVSNVAIEVPFKDHFSIDASAYYSPYTINNEWKIRVAMLQPEVRYWLSSPMDKHFFGVHAHVGLFNISTNQWSRYQNSTDEPLWGAGVSYGYALYLSRALSLEFNVGAGYASLRYDTFYNVENGALYNHTQRGYWGVTRAGISLNYIINRK